MRVRRALELGEPGLLQLGAHDRRFAARWEVLGRALELGDAFEHAAQATWRARVRRRGGRGSS
jgi:elongation factor P--beta-lysine ligase